VPAEIHLTSTTTPTGGRELAAILHWQHHNGGPAHCLVRWHRSPPPARPVAVVSEIRSNPEGRGIDTDFPAIGAALLTALLTALPPDDQVDPAEIIWIAHHGEFSYYDEPDSPESFTAIEMRWEGGRYQDDLHWHRELPPSEAAALLSDMPLAPVPEALSRLGWQH
jgi:hypothetical protein